MSGTAERLNAVDITVVIPVRNAAQELPDQLSALASQDFSGRWEVVVADNGSTDATAAVAAAWTGLLPSLRVLDAGARPGPSHARNVGVAAAQGEWVAFCDGDDVVEPSWLSSLWAARAGAEAVAGGLDIYALNRPDVLELPPEGGVEARISMRTEMVTDELPRGTWDFLPFAYTSNLMVRRRVIDEVGGFDESLRYCEDVDFLWKVQLAGGSLVTAKSAVVNIRLRGTTVRLLRQCLNYGEWDAEIYRRYRGLGARSRSPRALGGRLLWLTLRSPYLVLGLRRRRRWVKVLGEVVGRLIGAWHTRQWYF